MRITPSPSRSRGPIRFCDGHRRSTLEPNSDVCVRYETLPRPWPAIKPYGQNARKRAICPFLSYRVKKMTTRPFPPFHPSGVEQPSEMTLDEFTAAFPGESQYVEWKEGTDMAWRVMSVRVTSDGNRRRVGPIPN